MDNILGNRIGRGRLSSENHGNGTLRQIALLDLQILINGVKRIHLLALVFVKTFYLYVKNDGSEFEENILEKLADSSVIPRGLGIGLLNIHKRLRLAFGEGFGLSLYNEDDLAVARIAIPYTYLKEESPDAETDHRG